MKCSRSSSRRILSFEIAARASLRALSSRNTLRKNSNGGLEGLLSLRRLWRFDAHDEGPLSYQTRCKHRGYSHELSSGRRSGPGATEIDFLPLFRFIHLFCFLPATPARHLLLLFSSSSHPFLHWLHPIIAISISFSVITRIYRINLSYVSMYSHTNKNSLELSATKFNCKQLYSWRNFYQRYRYRVCMWHWSLRKTPEKKSRRQWTLSGRRVK